MMGYVQDIQQNVASLETKSKLVQEINEELMSSDVDQKTVPKKCREAGKLFLYVLTALQYKRTGLFRNAVCRRYSICQMSASTCTEIACDAYSKGREELMTLLGKYEWFFWMCS